MQRLRASAPSPLAPLGSGVRAEIGEPGGYLAALAVEGPKLLRRNLGERSELSPLPVREALVMSGGAL